MPDRDDSNIHNIEENIVQEVADALIDSGGYVNHAAAFCGISRDRIHRLIRNNRSLEALLRDIRADRRNNK